MKKFSLIPFVFAVIALFSLSSCNDETENKKTTITPDECKSRMDQIGQSVIGKINAYDHKELIKTIDKFCENLDYGDIEFNRNVGGKMRNFALSVSRMIEENQLDEVSKMTSANSELYALSQYYGVYTFDEAGSEWTYMPSNESLEFHFIQEQKPVVVKVVSNGAETSYNPYPEYDVLVPEKVEASILHDNKVLASVKVNFVVNDTDKSVKTRSEIEASGYKIVHNLDANKHKATSDLLFTIGGEQIIKCNVAVDGDYMTDPDNIENAVDGNGDIQDLFKGASGNVVILNDATIKVSCKNIKNYINESNRIDDSLDNWYESYFEDYNRKMCDVYNNYFSIELYYNDQPDELVANLFMDLDYDEDFVTYYYEHNWETGEWLRKEINGKYDNEMKIVFASDNSKYSLDSYFSEENFGNLVDNTEDLIDKYKSFLDYLW